MFFVVFAKMLDHCLLHMTSYNNVRILFVNISGSLMLIGVIEVSFEVPPLKISLMRLCLILRDTSKSMRVIFCCLFLCLGITAIVILLINYCLRSLADSMLANHPRSR